MLSILPCKDEERVSRECEAANVDEKQSGVLIASSWDELGICLFSLTHELYIVRVTAKERDVADGLVRAAMNIAVQKGIVSCRFSSETLALGRELGFINPDTEDFSLQNFGCRCGECN